MTTSTVAEFGSSSRPKAQGTVTFRNLLDSEWVKFWSLRSTRWALFGAALTMLTGIVITVVDIHSKTMPHNFNSIDDGVAGFHLAELPIAVLGVMVITGEYATGMIRSTFMAAPARLPVLWAKLSVFAAVVFAAMLPFSLIAFYAVQGIVHSRGLSHSLFDHNALRAVVGSAVVLVMVGTLGTALGALTRNTAAGISSVVALLYLLPAIATLLGSSVAAEVSQYLPANAIEAFATNKPDLHMLSPWLGLATFVGYTAVALVLAVIRLQRRDV